MSEPNGSSSQTAPTIVVTPQYLDPVTGALYVHKDLIRVREDWDMEAHIAPVSVTDRYGDVESWVAYVQRFGNKEFALLSWNSSGLKATLDYHSSDDAGRCTWVILHEFTHSREWKAWTGFASGNGVAQKVALEFLEDHAEDVLEPPSVDLMALLRGLRTTVASSASANIQPDGTTSVSFSQDKTLKGGAGSVELPSYLQIAVPVLKGHMDGEGRPVRYSISVRLRASVGDDARLALRFSLPNAERVLETAYAERVELAKVLLGDEYSMLRAAG